jgi:hypothetical protein
MMNIDQIRRTHQVLHRAPDQLVEIRVKSHPQEEAEP